MRPCTLISRNVKSETRASGVSSLAERSLQPNKGKDGTDLEPSFPYRQWVRAFPLGGRREVSPSSTYLLNNPRQSRLGLPMSVDKGIHCSGCEARIQNVLSKLPGIQEVKANYKTQNILINLDPQKLTVKVVKEKLEELGYRTE